MKVKLKIESDFPLGTQGKIYDVQGSALLGKLSVLLGIKLLMIWVRLVGFQKDILNQQKNDFRTIL